MSRRKGLRGALAGLGMLMAGCALAQPAPDFRPAPRSTLQTQREPVFVVARSQHGERTSTLLARPRAGQAPLLVWRIVQQGQGAELRIAVQRLDEAAADELPALEQLYVLLLRQEPTAAYCWSERAEERPGEPAAVPAACSAGTLSHAQALQALAARRERAAAAVPGAVPWRVVEIGGALRRAGDPDFVGVGASGPDGPLERATLYFNRAPHSICAARTDAEGRAACRLEDQHGDGDQHDHATTVVVTFPGEVRPDRVLLPTTWVLPGLPSFARPLAFPGTAPPRP